MRDLLRDASLFFLLQVTVALVYNSDQLILTAVATPSEVAVYATVAKVFSIVTLVNGLLISPLWPAYTDARARDDWSWIRSAYYRSRRRSGVVSFVLAATLLMVGTPLIAFWTHGRIQAPVWMLATMGVWVVLEGYGQCMAMLLNAARIVRLQLFIALALLVFGIGLKIYLSTPLGVYGPLVGTIVSFTLVVAVYETRYIHQLLALHK
jgi:O-antigen/teichoic acid export membrane protein